MSEKKTNIYLDYLDKEMTIMGILSTFCVLVSGGALDRLSGKGNPYFEMVWQNGHSFVILGSLFALLAALCFYLQRSLLAWYFGQISLCLAKDAPDDSSKSKDDKTEYEYGIDDWYADADSWPTWIRYNCGFGFLILAFIEYGFALIKQPHFVDNKWFYLATPFLILLPFYLCWIWLLFKYRYEDNPVTAFFWRKTDASVGKKDQ
jgi:hypothetical protein